MQIIKPLALALALASASTIGAQEVTLRFQHFVSAQSIMPTLFMQPWVDKVAEESDGRLQIQLYPAMQLGGTPPALFDQIRDNIIDGGWTVAGYTPGRFPGAEVFELPFISSNSAEASSKAAFEFYQKYLEAEFSEVKILALHVHGPGAIHTKDADIASAEDFAGLKLRAPTRMAAKIIENLGATPVGMPVPQLPESVSKGVVDGGVIPFEIVPPLRMHELATAHTQLGGDRALYNIVFIWAMNKSVYESLPADLRAVIDANSGLEASAAAGRAMDEGDVRGLAAVERVGNSLYTLEGADLARVRELTAPIVDEWIAETSAKGLPAAAMVEEARALVAKYD